MNILYKLAARYFLAIASFAVGHLHSFLPDFRKSRCSLKNWGRAGGAAECRGRAAEFWSLYDNFMPVPDTTRSKRSVPSSSGPHEMMRLKQF
ncbi:hypothetical protein I8752_35865 [Nostocaceae cyanobacterium CENA369]|uniref:Uncharacterized protein n=1 Tax=Dendronalium phyllosphericum CENA369 TaxID=1725256 RepID=A0A8J7IDY7_9NOST|nr:hypothetical protein [Dendronalium phyllosphericum]MBH8578230.1 hypothetical protein [Dendronalium phyllosphericum CENA369]